jgi:hypothetical protein
VLPSFDVAQPKGFGLVLRRDGGKNRGAALRRTDHEQGEEKRDGQARFHPFRIL